MVRPKNEPAAGFVPAIIRTAAAPLSSKPGVVAIRMPNGVALEVVDALAVPPEWLSSVLRQLSRSA